VLDAVALAIAPGDTVAIVGPNGAGKSTLLRVLSGEIKPNAGQIALKGRPLASFTPRTLALHRAVLSQNVTVAFPFTVADVVRMGAGERQGATVEALVAAALQEVDLADEGGRIITTLGRRAATSAFRARPGSTGLRGSGPRSRTIAARRADGESRHAPPD
jgi:iron complex transport system ATP-binding protein